ncbi:MAG TPA: hypothetical protein VJ768_11015 [Anaerolineales bacterium]|nr:hypothetical protein [Anaerolineales bacterium]
MKPTHRVWIGGLMILAGAIFLLENLGFIAISPYLWGGLLLGGGLTFLYLYLSNREEWWYIIPAFIFLGVGAILILLTAFPNLEGALVPTIILGAIGLSFVIVYLTNSENWWAIIPAGTLLTLSLALGLSTVFEGLAVASIFFLGMALTFGIVYFIPTPEGRMTWAIYPALITLALGVVVSLGAGSLAPFIWPLALILGGLALIYRTFRSR